MFAKIEAYAKAELAHRKMRAKLAGPSKGTLEKRHLVDRFHLEPTDPSMVGMDSLSDQFDPDELVRLVSKNFPQ